jgi:hypothetical protein
MAKNASALQMEWLESSAEHCFTRRAGKWCQFPNSGGEYSKRQQNQRQKDNRRPIRLFFPGRRDIPSPVSKPIATRYIWLDRVDPAAEQHPLPKSRLSKTTAEWSADRHGISQSSAPRIFWDGEARLGQTSGSG